MDRNSSLAGGGAILLILLILFLFAGGGEGTCSGDADCSEGEVCGPEGTCTSGGGIGAPCEGDDECDEGLICVDGFCTESEEGDGTCTTSEDCPSGQICIDGFCFEDEGGGIGDPCEGDDDCDEGLICVDGFCTESEEGDGTCTTDEDCPLGQICVDGSCTDEDGIGPEECIECPCILPHVCVGGCCVFDPDLIDVIPVLCEPCEEDSDCENPGDFCIDNCCIFPEITIPGVSGFGPGSISFKEESYCDGCPEEDSLVTLMFLGMDLEGKEMRNTLIAEMDDKSRETVEDATVFITITASDLSSVYICRTLTDSDGTARYNYSDDNVCKDVGCNLKFTFCCADVSEGCLIPICLGGDSGVEEYTDVPECVPSGLTWPEKAKIDGSTTLPNGDPIYLYPAINDVSIPPEPKIIGGAFTFELCLPVMVIFGLLAAAMFISGRNPLQMFSLYNPRFKRAPQRALRARGMNWNISSIISSVSSAAKGVGKTSEGRTLKDKAKGLKGMKGKMKDIKSMGRSIKGGNISAVPKATKGTGLKGKGTETTGGKAGTGDSRASIESIKGPMDVVASGAHAGFGGFIKAFGAEFGSALLGKLLGGSGLTSWIVYGGGSFKGTKKLITEKLQASYAPTLTKELALLEKDIGFTVTAVTNEDGKIIGYTASYNAMNEEGTPRIEVGTNEEPASLSTVIAAYEGVVEPVEMAESISAKRAAAAAIVAGGPLHEGIQATIEDGSRTFGIPKDEAGTLSSLDAEAKLHHQTPTEDVPGILLSSDDLKNDVGKPVTDNPAVDKWVNNLETKVAQGTLTSDDLKAATEIFNRASQDLGAGVLAQNENLSKLGGVIVDGSKSLLDSAPPAGRSEALEQAMYSQASVANTGIKALDEGAGGSLVNVSMPALGDSYSQADQMVLNQEKGTTATLSEMTSNFGEATPESHNSFVEINRTIDDGIIAHEQFKLQNGLDDGTSQTADYLLNEVDRFKQAPPGYETPYSGPFAKEQKPGSDYEKARAAEMIRQLDPASAANPFNPMGPESAGSNQLKPGTKAYEKNQDVYNQYAIQAQDAATTAIANRDLGSQLSDNVSPIAPVNMADSQAVERYSEQNFISPQELYDTYAPKAEVNYADVHNKALDEATTLVDPLRDSYKPPSDTGQTAEQRMVAYKDLEEKIDPYRGLLAGTPSLGGGRESALTNLYLAMDGSPNNPKSMNKSNTAELNRVAKQRREYGVGKGKTYGERIQNDVSNAMAQHAKRGDEIKTRAKKARNKEKQMLDQRRNQTARKKKKKPRKPRGPNP